MTKPSAFTQAAPGSGDGFPFIDTFGVPASGAERICDFDQLEAALTVANMADASTIALIAGNTYTGVHNFGGATSLEVPNSATPTVNADGEIAVDTTVTDFSHGVLKYYGGEELGVVAMPIAQFTTPTDGYVVAYNATNDEFELVANGAGGGLANVVEDTTPQLGGMLDVNGQAIGDGTLEILTFTEDPSAVNHVNIENQATGGGPIISAAGDDTNIDLLLAGKGSGVPKIGANAILDAGDIGVSVQAYDADLDTYAGITPSANVQSLLGAADYAAMRTQLDLEAGTDFYSVSGADAAFQPLDADLTAIAGISGIRGDVIVRGVSAWQRLAVGTTGQVLTTDGTDVSWGAGGGGISNVVEDTTPQLGGSLDVNGQSIVSVSAGNIAITPDTTGSIILDGLSWPQADGSADQVLKTDGAGQLSWTANSGSGIASVVDDTTPQLGGQLDVNGFALGDGTLELLKFSETVSAVNEITVANAATGNGPTISATGDDVNVDLNLAAKGSGAVKVGGNAVLDAGDIGSSVQAWDAQLDTWATVTPSANGQSLVSAANYAAMRTLLDLEAGTDFYSISAADAAFQPLDADLTTLATAFTTASATGPASLAFAEDTDNGSNTATIIAPASMAANRTITLPDADGTLLCSGGDLGTPSAGVATNLTGTAAGLTAGAVSTITGLAPDTATTAAAQPNITSLGTLTALDVDNININGNTIISTDTNGNITLTPNGMGNVVLGTLAFNADQTVGAGQDNYVLTYDNASGLINLEAATGGSGDAWSDPINSSITVDTDNTYDVGTGAATLKDIHARSLNAGTAAADILKLRGYDVDGTAYVDYLTVTSGNTPTADLNTAVTKNSDIIPELGVHGNARVLFCEASSPGITTDSGFTFTQSSGMFLALQDDETTTVDHPLRAVHLTSGTAAAGFGSGVEFIAENASGAQISLGFLEAEYTDPTNTSEDSDIKLYGVTAGSKTEYMHLDGVNQLLDIPTGWQFAVAGTPIGGVGLSNVVEDTTPQLGGQLDVNGNAIGDGTLELLSFTETASAVNHINITNAATGNGATLGVAGDDTNIDLVLAGKGSGVPKIGSNAILDAGDIGVSVQGYDATILVDADIGVNVQAYDADLTTWAGITPGTGVGTALAIAVGSAGAVVTNGGALGTPSSGTLTNATGLPVASVVGDTSTALGVGSVNLGHASDTTITRASAGNVSVEGTLLKKVGTETIWMPASAMTARTTSGAASGSAESTTNKVMIETLDFDTAADEFAQFSVAFPKSWNNGTVTAQFYWSNASGTGTVAWAIQGMALADSDVIDTAFGTAVVTTDTMITAGDLHVSPTSTAVTIAGTPGDDELVYFQVYRDVSADTLGVDARLHGVKLFYTTDAANDD